MGERLAERPELRALGKKKKGVKPSRVKFPSVRDVKARVGKAYEAAVKSVLAAHFSKTPPKKEFQNFRKEIKEELSHTPQGKNLNLGRVIENFRQNYPKSMLSKYIRSSTNLRWLKISISRSGRIKIKFSKSRLQKEVRSKISNMKSKLVKAAVKLVNPSKRSISVDVSSTMNVLPAKAATLFTTKFIAYIAGQTKKNKLYLKASYSSPNINYASTLPKPRKRTDVVF